MPNRADMDKKTEDGLTPLALAAQGGHVDVVRFLCEAGADLAAPSHRPLSPIMGREQ